MYLIFFLLRSLLKNKKIKTLRQGIPRPAKKNSVRQVTTSEMLIKPIFGTNKFSLKLLKLQHTSYMFYHFECHSF